MIPAFEPDGVLPTDTPLNYTTCFFFPWLFITRFFPNAELSNAEARQSKKGESEYSWNSRHTFPPAKKSGSVPCNEQAVGNESVAQERRKVLENSEL